MAITRYAGDRFTVNTSDTKPTGVLDGAYLIDTGNLTQWVRRTAGGTSQWNQLAGGGGGGGTPGGANTQVQFNNAGAFGGDADLTFTNGNRLNVNKLGISGNIYDSNNSIGEGGMVLTNEGTTGVNWKNIESVLSGVGGSGVANYVARWSDEDTITSGVIQDDGTAVGINQAADPDNALAIKSIANNTNPLQIAAHDGDSLLVFRQTAGDGRLSIKKDGGVETIRLDSDNVSYINGGNFGLGTAAPAAPLDVQSANADSVGIRVTAGYKMQFLNSSNNTNSNIYNNGASGVAQLDFQIAGATKVTIDNDGNVGIGTTDPGGKLESYITSGGEKGLRLNSNFAGGNTVDFIPAIVGVSNAGFSIDLAGTNRFVINSGGNVGIGTNAPTRKLEVIETTNAAAATFETRENGGIAAVELRARDLSAPTVALPSGQGPALTFQGFSGSTFQTMATIFASTEATAANNDVPSSLLFLTTPDGAAAATEKMRIKSDGNVGIGTASPTHKLEVIGNSYIDATAGSPTLSLGRYSGQPSIKAASDDGGYLLMDSNGGRAGLNWYSSDHVVLANGGGHVGIGTDAPTEKLDVEGSLVLNVATGTGLGEEGIFFRRGFSDSNKYNISILAYAHDGAGNFSDGISINGYDGVSFCTGSNTRQERMRIVGGTGATSGYVGIGTTAPLGKLHVYGGQVRILDSTASPSYGARLVVGRDTAQDIEFYVDDLNCKIVADQDSDTNGNHNFVLDRSFAGNGDNNFQIQKGGSSQFLINTDGNVGINNTSPEHRLHVAGDAIISGYLYDSTNSTGVDGYVLTSKEDGPQWKMIEDVLSGVGGNGTANYIPKWIDSDTIGDSVIAESGGNIGIGTVTPEQLFEISATGDAAMQFQSTATQLFGGETIGAIKFKNNDSSGTDPHICGAIASIAETQYGRAGLAFSTGRTTEFAERMRIRWDGNVGIAITDPDEKLEVDGNIKIGSDKFYRMGGDAFQIGADGSSVGMHFHAGGSERMTLLAGGNVGIGVTNANAKLKVVTSSTDVAIFQSTHATTTNFYISNSNATASNTANLYFGPANGVNGALIQAIAIEDFSTSANRTADLAFQTRKDGTFAEHMRIDSSGNVGIGTNNPTGKFQIGANYTIPGTSYGGDDIYIANTGSHSNYDPSVTNTDDFRALIAISDGTTTGPIKPGLILYNDDTTAGGFSPMLLFAKRETGASPYKAATAAIYARSPLGTGNSNSWIDGELIFATAGAATQGIRQRMVINKEGLVGIGTNAPAGKLHIRESNPGSFVYDSTADTLIVEGNGNAGITIATAAANTSRIIFASPNDATGAEIKYSDATSLMTIGNTNPDDSLAFQAGNGVEAVRIISDGNVGIGTTSPSYELHVVGSSYSSVRLGVQALNTSYIATLGGTTNNKLVLTGSSQPFIRFQEGTTDKAYIQWDSSEGLTFRNQEADNFNFIPDADGSVVLRLQGADHDNWGMFYATENGGAHEVGILDGDGAWAARHVKDTSWDFRVNGVIMQSIDFNGAIQFNSYGSGTHTGTAAYRLMVDSSGNVIEGNLGAGVVDGSGTANTIPRWTDADTIGDSIITVPSNTSVVMAGPLTLNYTSPILNIGKLNTSTGNAKLQFNSKNGTAANAYIIEYVKSATEDRLDFLGGGGTAEFSFLNSGQVGIGTTAPASLLHVGGAAATPHAAADDFVIAPAATDVGMTIRCNSNSGTGSIFFADTAANAQGTIRYNHNSDYMSFYSTGDFFFDGSVGIGTNAPNELLEVDGNIRLGDGTHRNIIGPTNATLGIYSNPNDSNEGIKFSTDGGSTIEMFLQDGGNVGIGTETPKEKLHVNNGSSSGDGVVYPLRLSAGAQASTAGDATGIKFIQRDQYNDYGGYIRLANTASNPGYLNPRLEFGVQNTNTNVFGSVSTKMVITGGGSVGIGEVTPGTILHLKQNDAVGPTISLTNNPKTAYINFWGATGGGTDRTNQFEINAVHTGYGITLASKDYVRFKTDGIGAADEAMRIDSDGNVGIGTTDPGVTLDVRGKLSIGSPNTSYDLYNNGTTYLNGNVTVDATLSVTGGVAGVSVINSSTTDSAAADSYLNIFKTAGSGGGSRATLRVGYDAANCFQVSRIRNNANIYINSRQSGSSMVFQIADNEQMALSSGQLKFPDSKKIIMGTGNDLEIYHDGSNSYIKEASTGDIILDTNSNIRFKSTTEHLLNAAANGAVELYYNNAKTFQTTASGVKLTQSASYLFGGDGEILAGQDSGGYYFATGAGQNVNKPIFIGDNASYIKFKTSDSEVVRIDANGNVGIGTTNPGSYKLLVNGNSYLDGTAYVDDNLTVDGYINFETMGDYLTFYGNAAANHSISSRNSSGTAADDIRINTYGALFINLDSNGNDSSESHSSFQIGRHAGTGAVSASDLLLNLSGETGKLRLYKYGSGTHTGTAAYQLSVDANGNVIETTDGGGNISGSGSGTANKVAKFTGANTIGNSQITDNGTSVGINTGSPAAANRLQINGQTKGTHFHTGFDWTAKDGGFHVGNDGLTAGAVSFYNGSNSSANIYRDSDTFYVGARGGTSTQGLAIDGSGKVGIGTTGPTYKLDVETASEIVASFVSTDNKASINISDDDTAIYVSAENSKGSFGFNVGVHANNLNIDSSGNVGIGTASPGSILSVVGTTGINVSPGASGTYGSSSAINNLISLTMPYGSSAATTANAGARVGIAFRGATSDPNPSSDNNKTAAIYGVSEDTGAGYSRKMGLALYTSSFDATASERVRINADGNVGIGTATPRTNLHVYGTGVDNGLAKVRIGGNTNNTAILELAETENGSGAMTYGFSMRADGGSGGGSTNDFQLRYHNNSASGVIGMTMQRTTGQVGIGGVYSGTYRLYVHGDGYMTGNLGLGGTLTEASSLAIKENIETFEPSLDIINKIRPVKYDKKTTGKKEIGLIAEELAELFPELVERDKNGNPSGVNYSRAVTVLLGGFKELYKEVQELKKRI